MKFDLRIRMDEELTEILCENVWEKDIHPYWKDNVWVWIFKILFAIWAIGYTGLISLACILGYRLEIYMGNMGVYLVEEVGVCLFCSIIWLVTAHQEINAYGSLACILGYRLEIYMGNMGVYLVEEVGVCLFCSIIWLVTAHQEINAYGRWEKKMNRCMKNVGNTIYITDQKIHAVFREKEMEWNWEQAKWYRVYSQILLIYVDKIPIYVDLRALRKEERVKLRELLRPHASLNQEERLTKQFHISAMKNMRKVSEK